MTEVEEDFLEADNPIPGQNYVCLSFLSPDDLVKSKELYMFHRFMTQRCGEWEQEIDKVLKKCSEDTKNKIERDLKRKTSIRIKIYI